MEREWLRTLCFFEYKEQCEKYELNDKIALLSSALSMQLEALKKSLFQKDVKHQRTNFH